MTTKDSATSKDRVVQEMNHWPLSVENGSNTSQGFAVTRFSYGGKSLVMTSVTSLVMREFLKLFTGNLAGV